MVHVELIPALFDLLESRIIVFIMERVPGHARGVPFWIGKIGIGMVNECAVAHCAGHGHTACFSEDSAIKLTNPSNAVRFSLGVLPTGGIGHRQNRLAMHRGRRVGCNCVDLAAVGGHAHAPADIWLRLRQVVIDQADLTIRETLTEEGIFEFERATRRTQCDQVWEGIQDKG